MNGSGLFIPPSSGMENGCVPRSSDHGDVMGAKAQKLLTGSQDTVHLASTPLLREPLGGFEDLMVYPNTHEYSDSMSQALFHGHSEM